VRRTFCPLRGRNGHRRSAVDASRQSRSQNSSPASSRRRPTESSCSGPRSPRVCERPPGRRAASSSCPALRHVGDGQQGLSGAPGRLRQPLGPARGSESQVAMFGLSGLSPVRRAGSGEVLRSRAIRKAARVVPPARTARLGANAMATSARIVTGGPLRNGRWADPAPTDGRVLLGKLRRWTGRRSRSANLHVRAGSVPDERHVRARRHDGITYGVGDLEPPKRCGHPPQVQRVPDDDGVVRLGKDRARGDLR
jgi:hypothetical protein